MALTLTEERRVAWKIQGIGPDPAHVVVVFKKIGTGRTLYKILRPREVLKPAWFESLDSYAAYAVSNDENLGHSFSRKYQWVNSLKTFTLHFDLNFQVSDAESLALKLENDDPLRRLEEQVARVLSATARHLPWEMLEQESPDFGICLLAAESTEGLGERKGNFDRLRDFAAKLGIDLRHIGITRSLTEADLRVVGKVDEVTTEIRISTLQDQLLTVQAQLSHKQETQRDEHQWGRDLIAAQRKQVLEGMERLRMVLDGIAREGIRAVSQPVDGIRSFPALHDAFMEIQNIQVSLTALSGGQSYAPALNAAADRPPTQVSSAERLLEASTRISDPMERLVIQAFNHLRGLSGNPEDQRRILAAVLHLIAEAGLGREADEEFLAACSGELRARLQPVKSALEDKQIAFLQSIMKVEELRQKLG